MKIRTFLLTSAVIFSVIILIISGLVILTNLQIQSLVSQEEIANRIALEVNELGYLSNDYLLFREPRQAERWNTKFVSVSNNIARLSVDKPGQKAIVDNLKVNLRNTRSVFDDIILNPVQPTGAAETSFVQISWSRMAVQNQGLVFDAGRLANLLHEESENLMRVRNLLIFSLMGVFIVFLFTSYFIFYRRALKSISSLDEGTRIIGSGNLNYTIETGTDDEIGDLSIAINRMTADLRNVLAKKTDLEREMSERMRAEAQLVRNNENLNALNEELTAAQEELKQNVDELSRREIEIHSVALFPIENPSPTMRINESGILLFANPASSHVISCWKMKVGEKVPDHIIRSALDSLEQGIMHEAEEICEPFTYSIRFAPITTQKYINLYFSDITERKHAGAELIRTNENLNALNEELTAAQEELHGKIQELTMAEKQIRESEDRYRTVADFTFDWEFWIDPEGRYKYISPSADQIVGKPVSQFVSADELFREIIHPDDLQTRLLHLTQEKAGQDHLELEFRIVRPDGEVRWIHHVCQPIHDEKGKFLGTRGSNRDITERKQIEESLHESEEKYRLIFETANEGIWITDADRKTILVNQRMADMLGYSTEEMLGKTPSEYLSPDQEHLRQETRENLAKGVSTQTEFKFHRKDGSDLWVISSASPVFDSKGRYVRTVSLLADITERKRAEEALLKSEEEYRHLVTHAPAAIYEISADGLRFQRVNEAMCQILGYTHEELLAMNPFDILNEESKIRFRERVRKRLAGEDIDESTAYRIVGRDGREIWATLNIRLNHEKDGGSLVVAHDITERMGIEEKLRKAYELTSMILDSISGSFFALDQDWKFTYINQRAASPNICPGDLIGKSIWEVFPEIIGTPLETIYREVMTNRKPRMFENESNVASGRYFEFHAYPIGDTGLAIFGQEITERKEAELALREAHKRTSAILEGVADTFYSLDNQWRFTTVNPAAEKAPFGRPAVEMLGKVIWELYPALVGTRIHQHYLDAAEKNSLEHYEAKSPLNGRWYEVFMQGREGGVDVYMRDITDRKRAEEALLVTDQRFRLALKNAPVSVAIQDVNLVFAWAYNQNTTKPEEIIGKTDSDIFIPEDATRLIELKRNVIETGKEAQEQIWLTMNGKRMYSYLYIEPLRNTTGQITGIGTAMVDQTLEKLTEIALRDNEKRLREANDLLEAVTDATKVIIAAEDTNFRYTYFNKTYAAIIRRLTGKEILTGMSMIDLFSDTPEEQRSELNEWSKVMNGQSVNERIKFDDPKKGHAIYNVLHVPLRDAKWEIIGAGEIAFDVTSQVKVEETLRETSQYLTNLIDYANAPIIVWDPRFRITLFNHAFEHLTGRKAKEVIGHHLEILLPENYLSPAMDLIHKATEGERWESVEIPILHKKGAIRTVLWNSAAIFGSDGKTIIATIAQGQDITDRKKIESEYKLRAAEYAKMNVTLKEEIGHRESAETNLKETLSLLNASFESTADGILVVDREGRITGYNQNFVNMWDISTDMEKIRHYQALIQYFQTQVKDPEKFLLDMKDLLAHPVRESYDVVELTNGRIFERYSKPQKIGKTAVGRVWSYRDITDRRRSEERLFASLQEKEVLLREIHHRVKNNLQLVTGLLDMTRMRTKDEATTSILTDMMLKIQTMAQIHTRLYESKQFGKISLTGQFRDQIVALSNIYSFKGHEICCEINAEEIFLTVDQALPCALVVNEILSNSYKHAFKGKTKGSIVISAKQENGEIRITVRDDGIGMPADFDVSRANSLGLKLIRTLVEHQLRGCLTINSLQGTETIIEFPIIIAGT